jgi:enediyne biosynthesis protein E5
MTVAASLTSRYLYPKGSPRQRMFALCYFAALITLWTIAGHTVLGWEQSWATPVVAVATAVAVTLVLEAVRAWSLDQSPLYARGIESLASLLLPALIPALAVAMLLYPNERLAPIAFAAATAIASKALIRAPFKGSSQHIVNPSNFGIVVTLLLFPSVGLAPPYHLTENVTGAMHWLLPGAILASGILVHALFTGRLPLCVAWLSGFIAQGFVRHLLFGVPWVVPLMPMTSAAFILFTLYMIPDPATTPLEWKRQVAFGLAVAALYGILISVHIVFGLFLALVGVCLLRGCGMWISDRWERRKLPSEAAEVAVA